jgi:hypothetical protein
VGVPTPKDPWPEGEPAPRLRATVGEAEAWGRYLDDTRAAGAAYGEVEPWAWRRLRASLARLRRPG